MKSLLIASALALAVHGSRYYIGNYTALGVKTLVPFPLGVCVPNGAFTFNYVVYDCANDTHIYFQKYLQSDTDCSGSYTDGYLPIQSTPGKSGYASCNGVKSYLEIMQYLGSCSSWEAGNNGLATTVIASDACIYHGQMSGFSIYAKTVCDGNGQTTYAYASDFSCSVPQAIVQVSNTPIGCSFYDNTTSGDVYSAMTRCVQDSEIQRCDTPISKYSSHVMLNNLIWNVNTWDVYSGLFPYATLALKNISKYDSATNNETLEVNATFCTEWEDRRYGKYFKTMAAYTLSAADINDNATICATCVFSWCTNSTMCGGSSYCGSDCAPEIMIMSTTTSSSVQASKDNKSAAALFVSFFTFFFVLLFSVY